MDIGECVTRSPISRADALRGRSAGAPYRQLRIQHRLPRLRRRALQRAAHLPPGVATACVFAWEERARESSAFMPNHIRKELTG